MATFRRLHMAKWTCANCERTAGNLEEPRLWGDWIVCDQCYRLLRQQAAERVGSPEKPQARGMHRPVTLRRLFYVLIGLGLLCAVIAPISGDPAGPGGAAMFFLGLTVLLFPGLLADERHHPNTMPIVILCLVAGWTVIGWIVALIWSLMAPPAAQSSRPPETGRH